MSVCLQYPSSRGSLHITSSSPSDLPNIDPGYLSHPANIAVLSAAMSEYFLPRSRTWDDEHLEGWLRKHVQTKYHPMGTAAMEKLVDERLRVYGVKDLEVCDASVFSASVFSASVGGSLGATVYAVAEKAADMIAEDWS